MDPLSLHKNLQILTRNKIKHVILEASSHGLAQKRLDNLNINFGYLQILVTIILITIKI